MKAEERFFNLFLGMSIMCWGVAGLFSDLPEPGLSVVRGLTTCFNIVVGALVLFRSQLQQGVSLSGLLSALPSLLLSGLLFRFSRPFHEWGGGLELLFAVGTLLALISLLNLGRNFSILPQRRGISEGGLYRLVRHPIYLGESLMLLACLLSAPKGLNLLVFILFVPFLVLRIHSEEKLLCEQASYLRYRGSVRWRLVPYLW